MSVGMGIWRVPLSPRIECILCTLPRFRESASSMLFTMKAEEGMLYSEKVRYTRPLLSGLFWYCTMDLMLVCELQQRHLAQPFL